MLTGGWRIARIGGVDVRVDPSLAFIAILITFNFWIGFSQGTNSLSSGAAAAMAALTALLFFASILIHELAHAGVSRLRDIPVLGITLWMLGGATHAKIDARGPADEFLVSVVGPLSSLGLSVVFFALRQVAAGLNHPVVSMFGTLAEINILLALFNLLPGFPLDGGRILRSALWKLTGNLGRATRWAARAGQVTGLLIIGAGLLVATRAGALAVALWPALIGWFLYRAARDSLTAERAQEALRAVRAGDLMQPPPPVIPADLPVREAVAGYLAGHSGESFPVMEDGRVVGFVSMESVARSTGDRPVREAMMETRGVVQAGSEDDLAGILGRLREHGAGTVLVVDDGRVVGAFDQGDIERYLEPGVQRDPGGRSKDQTPYGGEGGSETTPGSARATRPDEESPVPPPPRPDV